MPMMRECPYCTSEIARAATRCPQCAGELLWCPKCNQNVAVETKGKFVGVLRGGTKDQKRCRRDGTVLAGPRF